MYLLKVLPGLRCASRNHQLFRQLHGAAFYLLNPCRACAPCNGEVLGHAEQRTFLRSYSSQIQPYASGRWFSSQPVGSEDGVLIYTGTLGKAVLGVKFFSYSSSVFSLCLMPFILTKTGIGVSSLALQAAFCGVIGFFTFMTPLLLHLVTKGYVVRLYHNRETDTYTAVTYSALLAEKRTVFGQSQVQIPDVSRMFTTFYADGRSMLVNPELFELPHDYNHLMGYDRPFSFDAEDVQKQDKS